mgnify:CR=1 FL=1
MIEKERQVLIILPHPDDESLGMGGTIARYRKMDVPVRYVCLTLGEMGRAFGNPPFADRESLPLIRKGELKRACEAMNLTDVHLAGMRDKTLEFEDERAMTERMKRYIEETNPSVLYSFYPGFAVHPDHEAAARAIMRAVEEIPKANRPKLRLIAFANDTEEKLGKPPITHDVSSVRDEKLAALKAHDSQVGDMIRDVERQVSEGNEEAIEWLDFEHFYTM